MPKTTPNLETSPMISLKEAAQVAGVSVEYLRDAIAAGHLPAYRGRPGRGGTIGRLIRVRLADVEALFDKVA